MDKAALYTQDARPHSASHATGYKPPIIGNSMACSGQYYRSTGHRPLVVPTRNTLAGRRGESGGRSKLITDTLPDGSDVVLNKTTTLAYVYDKRKKVHEVQLKGEAYFNIHHNGDEKFVIDAGGVFIRDIGTSFNVRAYPESDLVEVLVEEGEVIFYKSETQDDSSLYLRAGGKGVYNKKTGAFTVEDPEPNTLSYKTKFFTFSGQNLETVVETLNKVYDKKITVSKAIKKCPLTVSFNDETIEEIAQVIAETLGLTVTEANGRIVLEGESCR